MAHSRDRAKKEKRKSPKEEKKNKGIPPHLQRQREDNGSLQEIRRHITDLEDRQK